MADPSLRRLPIKPERQQLSERVATYLREAIMAGALSPGSYIRTERLAADLEVSATPVREALMILHSEGSVRWEPRRGFWVLPLSREDVLDLFLVQSWIAGELAGKAASVLTSDDVDRLEKQQEELELGADRGDVATVDGLNYQIHRTINRASSSTRMAAVLNSMVNYVPLRYFEQIPGWAEASAHDHAPILEALRAGNAESARDAMGLHVRHIGSLLIDHLVRVGVFQEAGSLSNDDAVSGSRVPPQPPRR